MKRITTLAVVALFAASPVWAGGEGCGSMKGHPKVTEKDLTGQDAPDAMVEGFSGHEWSSEALALPPGHPSVEEMEAAHANVPQQSI